MLKEEYKIARQILINNTAGYNVKDHKALNYSGYYKTWYTKEFTSPTTIRTVVNISRQAALNLIKASLL